MNKVFILTPDSQSFAEKLGAHSLPDLEIFTSDTVPTHFETVADCNILLGQPTLIAQILPQAPQVQWIQSSFAGVEALCDPSLPSHPTLTGVKEIFGRQMSEYVFLYMLALERDFLGNLTRQKASIWHDTARFGLEGLTLGVCGFGSIGQHIARTARHFGMKVWGFNSTGRAHPDAHRMFSQEEMATFLEPLDYLVLTLPHTPQTHHLINAERLGQMKNSAVLINVGRGSLMDEKALAQALEEKTIQGAVLDVFEEEPLPPESPLWKMPNVFITPHNAASSFPQDIAAIFAENYQRFLKQQPLQYEVDRHKGY